MDATEPEPPYGCRQCGRGLSRRDDELRCPNGDVTVPIVDEIPHFPVPDSAEESSHETLFDRLAPIYETPLWFAPLYRFIGGPAAPRDDRSTVAAMLELDAVDDRDRSDLENDTASATEDDAPTVLDVACGTGRITRRVAADAGPVVGIDISAGMLERARRYAAREGIENATFARMSADRLWFDAGAFDRVTCCWALHIFPDVDAALGEIRRVLRPGGRFVGTALVEDYVLEWPPVRAVARGVLDAEPFAAADLRDRLGEAGFSGIEFDRRGATLFFRADAE